MRCYRAKTQDIPALLELAREFIAESGWGFTYNEANSLKILTNYIEGDETAVFIAMADKPCGFAMLAYDDEFHDERLGYVSKFYVAKHARATGCARMLAADMAAWFDATGCKHSYATATANIKGQEKLFENLLAKFGYAPCGQTLQREKL